MERLTSRKLLQIQKAAEQLGYLTEIEDLSDEVFRLWVFESPNSSEPPGFFRWEAGTWVWHAIWVGKSGKLFHYQHEAICYLKSLAAEIDAEKARQITPVRPG